MKYTFISLKDVHQILKNSTCKLKVTLFEESAYLRCVYTYYASTSVVQKKTLSSCHFPAISIFLVLCVLFVYPCAAPSFSPLYIIMQNCMCGKIFLIFNKYDSYACEPDTQQRIHPKILTHMLYSSKKQIFQ